MRRENFAIEFMRVAGYADEQVPKYSDATLQVPYNQHLGQCFFGVGGDRQDSIHGNGSLSMADSKELQQIVERAVAQVFDRQLPKLQSELVERVIAELPAASTEPGAGSGIQSSHANLVQAVASIHAGTTQKEILR